MKSCKAMAIASAFALTGVASASIITIELSEFSSDETDASLLSATVSYSVAGNVLTVSVTNDTAGINSYTISEVWFNFGGGVTGVSDGGQPTGWIFQGPTLVDGFGIFDFGSADGVGNDPDLIQPGETLDFVFNFTGTAGVKDFTTALSTEGLAVAAKFITGPGDDSAWGASIPAPGVLALLGVAGLVGTRGRRRR